MPPVTLATWTFSGFFAPFTAQKSLHLAALCVDLVLRPEASGSITSQRRYATATPRYSGDLLVPFNDDCRYFPVKSRYFGVCSDSEEGGFSGLFILFFAQRSLQLAALCADQKTLPEASGLIPSKRR